MTTVAFLIVLLGFVVLGSIYELVAWLQRRGQTLSELSMHHKVLRVAILVAIVLLGLWWVLHTRS